MYRNSAEENILTLAACACILFLSSITGGAFAQEQSKAIVSGRVTSAETAEPIENVNVFLSITTIGTSTDKEGGFRLTGVPVGIYDLVISRVGYERQTITLTITRAESLYYDIKLKPRIIQTGEIQVAAESPEDWKNDLKVFTKEFLGETENTNRCRIINPEVINFRHDEKDNTLRASSDSVIKVENLAFGYNIYIILIKFEWYLIRGYGRYFIFSKFQELIPHDEKVLSSWRKSRQKSYEGSLKQFLRAVSAGKAEDEQFCVYAVNLKRIEEAKNHPEYAWYDWLQTHDAAISGGHRVNAEELIVPSEEGSPFKLIRFQSDLRIEYWGRNPHELSFLTLKGPSVMIDTLGNLFNPLSLEVGGYWSGNRVAELLPMY